MTQAVDSLLIQSLPELNEAATALDALEARIGSEIDSEIQTWITNNGWAGVANWNDGTWLAPPEWMIQGDANTRAYLYFELDHTAAEVASYWGMASLLSCGEQRLGLWLKSDPVRKSEFNRLWREHSAASQMPLNGSEFFLPLTVDRELLATSIANDTVPDALESIRTSLDRLPQLASQLEPLKRAIEAAANKKAG